MHANQTQTMHSIQAMRAISERSLYRGETTTRVRVPVRRTTDDTDEQIETWARRAAQANGFGGM